MTDQRGNIIYHGDTIYRVTRKAYRGQSVKLCTRTSVIQQIAVLKNYRSRTGDEPDKDILKIERAEIGPFEDVTTDFLS